jgi:hypothetical protein
MGFGRHSAGYLRATTVAGRAAGLYEHRIVWESEHGPIPDGFHVHHVNENPADNRLENLRLVSMADHRRLHSNYLPDGLTKRCGCCDAVKPLALFPPRGDVPDGVKSTCRSCYQERGRDYMRARRAGGVM